VSGILPYFLVQLIVDYFAYAVRLAPARLLVRLVINYFTYVVRLALARLFARLVDNYFAYATRPGASARRAAPRAARH
jgi:hypothetical protein